MLSGSVCVKAACKHDDKIDPLLSISSTFNAYIFQTKVLCPAFLLLQFGFEFFDKRILAPKLHVKY